jgi:rSAM-associated Gly-rich repeat protein
MSTKNRISKALSVVLPAGAVGASFLLALSSAQAGTAPSASATSSTERPGVAARLEAIRAGISEIGNQAREGAVPIDAAKDGDGTMVPTWWGNGGWGRWHAGWGNGGWRFGWHNGGWGNGGWGNAGWGNGGWGNGGWHNWHNGWGNGWHNGGWGNGGWGNGGWHNFWHNW